MTNFIYDVLLDLQKSDTNLSQLTFVLPSKRAGVFLRHQLSKVNNRTIFAPKIISIEAFVEELAQIKTISNTELLFEFYSIYSNLTNPGSTDNFDTFSKWAQILLQDFNEIDRYLIPQKQIFDYLSAIQDINHWSVAEPKTEFVANYLIFWNKLHQYYDALKDHLLNQKKGYQGLIYREAVENLGSYIHNNPEKQHVFLGFNALNTAEETIIQELLQHGLAKIYWDIDAHFMKNSEHDAALFTRHHKVHWPYFKSHPFHWITDNYLKKKHISVYGIPKNIGQAKCIGSILKNIKQDTGTLQKTAVVLGDENLLIPVLNSLPQQIDALNITMGFPLKSIPLASLFEELFTLHKHTKNPFYFKDVINIVSHQFVRPLFIINDIDYAALIIETIERNNLIYLTSERLKEIAQTHTNTIIDVLFSNWKGSISNVLQNCTQLILLIKKYLSLKKASNVLALEYLFRFNELFNEITLLNIRYKHIKNLTTLYTIYKELLSSETLDFQGEPLQGLQIMGMLESRVLDFETVIISSVNEGVLPSGKSNNSFIPFDVKIENNLPTYKEKDAVYTYHFYRLLQRAKNVYILYNTEADVLTGGEKSRFIRQLELENIHDLHHQIITPQVPIIDNAPNIIYKTNGLHLELKEVASKGFSPSSLTNYIRNPIGFYYQKILKIKEHDDVEETVAANTLGTVVHNTLEDFYKPIIDSYLSIDAIKNMKLQIDKRVTYHFKAIYKEGDITKGKNLIIFEIAKRYISNFLDSEIASLHAGNTIKIIGIELENTVAIDIPELDYTVKLTGKIDRVDEFNGVTRIIDYKSGRVNQGDVELVHWEDITTDYKKHSKSFQVLMYAYMMSLSNDIKLPVEAGIISFKNLNSGFLKFAKKESPKSHKKESLITQDTLNRFTQELKRLIMEICNLNIPFEEKNIT
ncbi:PD-(D/E)XK nuclease family protein [Changchengzhania lutea]|uniref:PD-(D/E)XK nuclease family protein n=1 Tax=Changchengzhania lutea TaxID=2049305 RepID=UPI00115DB0CC|nr:PD-(D/E)XK nuclease family protein [Changchengzhania lutea]